MSVLSPFTEARHYGARELVEVGGVTLAGLCGDAAAEYRAATGEVVLLDRADRGLLQLSGRDRAVWLHNLVTNSVLTLDARQGAYAFAVNVKGRILFDLNILSLSETLWLEVDRLSVSVAAAHFDRYLFREDVRITDLSGEWAQLAVSGPRAARVAAALGVTNFAALPSLGHTEIEGGARLVRHDLAGGPGFELLVPRGRAPSWWDRLVEAGVRPAGRRTLDVLRIEAGLPWLGRDFDDTVLPPETGQIERGVSYQKGCYLGQEVIERLRSRGQLARRLVKLRVPDGRGLTLPAVLWWEGAEVGRITSLVPHPEKPYWPGLGYLKSSVTGFAGITAGPDNRAVTICSA